MSIDTSVNEHPLRATVLPMSDDTMTEKASAETVGQRVERAMLARGLGFNELDRLLEVSDGYTSRLCSTSRNPRASTLAKLSSTLRVRLEWLISGQDPMEEETSPTPPPISSGTRHKTFKDLPGWAEAERKARARYKRVPSMAWTGAGLFMSETPPEVIDESTVHAFAQAWLAGATESHREAAAEAEGRAAMAEEDAAYERKLAQIAPKAGKKATRR